MIQHGVRHFNQATPMLRPGGTAAEVITAVFAVGSIGLVRVQERTGIVSVDAAPYFSNADAYVLTGSPPSGVTMVGSQIRIDTDTVGRRSATALTVRGSKGAATVDQALTLSVGARRGFSMPTGDLSPLSTAARSVIMNGAAAAGALFARIDFDRYQIEGSEGVNSWALTDDLVQRAHQAGLIVLGIMRSSPAWAESGANVLPSNLTKWAAWVSAVVNRYPTIKHWQIWNEQNGAGFSTSYTSGAAFSPVMVAAYNAIRAIDSAATIIYGGLTASSAGDGSGAQAFLASGHTVTLNYDAMAIHPYRWNVPSKAWSDTDSWYGPQILRNLLTIMGSKGGGSKAIWITEDGGPTAGTDGATHTPLTEAQQASLALQTWDASCAADPRIGACIQYTYADRGGAADATENWFGVTGPSSGGLVAKQALSALSGIRRGKPELVIDGACASTGPGARVDFGSCSLAVASSRLRVTNGAADWSGAAFYVPVKTGATYRVRARIGSGGTAGGTVSIDAGIGGGGGSYYGTIGSNVDIDRTITPMSNTLKVFVATNTNVSGDYADFTNFSIQEQ